MEEIRNALGSSDPAIAEAAAMRAAQARVVDPKLAVPLVQAMSSPHEGVREWSASALENMNAPNDDDLAPLSELIREALNDYSLSDSAYWALTLISRLGTDGSPALEAVAQAADSEIASSVRERAVLCLSKMGSGAASTIPLLRRLASEDSPRLARLASRAISQISD